MFTGIIQSVGSVQRLEDRGGDMRMTFATGKLDISEYQPGDSIAVNGVCLTAVEFGEASFSADVSKETLSVTTFGDLQIGDPVNLEPALRLQDRLGGHLVSGHVDGVGSVVSRKVAGRSEAFVFDMPDDLVRYVADKGSICINGTSLTVNRTEGNRFSVNIVPHTLQETMLGTLQSGHRVNLEVDLIARYLEKLLRGDSSAGSGIDLELLQRTGFGG